MNKAQLDYLFAPEKLAAFVAEQTRQIEPPLHVTRYDCPGRYLVRSESHVDVHYLVDLIDPTYPKGRCNCDDYDFRKEGKVRRKERIFRSVCKHIQAAQVEIEHARQLCADAGLEFTPFIIPTLVEYEHRHSL